MPEQTPLVNEVELARHYRFMYENFVLATQGGVYLLLEKQADVLHALYFDSPQLKYGGPNDEAHGGHPLARFGLGFYGFFEVHNSPWIEEQMIANRVHPRHSDSMFQGLRHYIACFKDVKLEVLCRNYQEKTLSMPEFQSIIQRELTCLEE